MYWQHEGGRALVLYWLTCLRHIKQKVLRSCASYIPTQNYYNIGLNHVSHGYQHVMLYNEGSLIVFLNIAFDTRLQLS